MAKIYNSIFDLVSYIFLNKVKCDSRCVETSVPFSRCLNTYKITYVQTQICGRAHIFWMKWITNLTLSCIILFLENYTNVSIDHKKSVSTLNKPKNCTQFTSRRVKREVRGCQIRFFPQSRVSGLRIGSTWSLHPSWIRQNLEFPLWLSLWLEEKFSW